MLRRTVVRGHRRRVTSVAAWRMEMAGIIARALLALSVASTAAQAASLRIEVRSDAGPVRDAEVVVTGSSYKTDAQGIAALTLAPGHIDVVVVKEGFAPASVSLELQPNQQQPIIVELNRRPSVE